MLDDRNNLRGSTDSGEHAVMQSVIELRKRGGVALGLGFLVVALLGLAGPSVFAQDGPEPKQADTAERLQPKEVTLSASVEPQEARPGDTVTYTLNAQIEDDWHIYAYTEDPPDGPVPTSFDFFGTGGLEPVGDWTPSSEPKSKPEPAFGGIIVQSHEGEISWTRDLKVPDDAEPGDRELLTQLTFQVCTELTCKPPARVTAPAATLTVLESDGEASPAQDDEAAEPDTDAAPEPTPPSAEPQIRDTGERLQPKQVSYSTSITPTQAQAGDTVTYSVTVQVEEPWHIYAYSPTHPEDGPRATQFDFFDTGGLRVVGDWEPDEEPITKPVPAFNNQEFSYHEDEVTWSIELQVPPGTEPGSETLYSQISFQICDPSYCLPPARVTVPPVVLTVLEGGLAATDAQPEEAAGSIEDLVAVEGPTGLRTDRSEADTPAAAAPTGNEVRRTIDQGLLPFLILSAGAGFLALIMPCVWPMVPITVNFFVKQGQLGKGSTTGLAVTYCFAIIATFTLIGLLASAFFGATTVQNLATNPWLNLFVAALFIYFGLMLLGVVEFGLPSFLVNYLNRMGSQGGLIGVIFMALTLTVTSFTCTFPVVGALLVMAAAGEYFYPVVGLLTFSAVLAFPFFLLALAPRLMNSMPRSGDWMNAVKVVGGLVEIGAAFKFLNNAEIGWGTFPSDAILNAPTVLTLWVVICLVCGVYLLGMFRTDHDLEAPRIGAGRILTGIAFLSLALFLSPALFGRPPQSYIWDRFVVGLLPPDVESLRSPITLASGGGPNGDGESHGGERRASSSDPEVAVTEEVLMHGVPWGLSYEEALKRSREENKPVLIDFTGVYCANCRQMEQGVFPRPEVVSLLKQFATVALYTDLVPIKSISPSDRAELATRNQYLQDDLVQDLTTPFYVALRPKDDGSDEVEILGSIGGSREPSVFVRFLQGALEQYENGRQLARAD